MARTQITGSALSSGTVTRSDMNTTSTGTAVITKVIAGTGVTISNTGVDAGTGDVTVNATINAPVVKSISGSATIDATYAPQTSGYQGIVNANSASALTVTIPLNATVSYPVGTIISVAQMGAGQVTIGAASGVTVVTASSLTTRAQYSTVTLMKMATTDTWLLTGDMS